MDDGLGADEVEFGGLNKDEVLGLVEFGGWKRDEILGLVADEGFAGFRGWNRDDVRGCDENVGAV